MNKTINKSLKLTPDLAANIDSNLKKYGLTFSEYVRLAFTTVSEEKLEQIKQAKELLAA
jgi:antitoxin component of RelBE/YafQ-DinJ toxin-antitoxin module